MDSFLATWSPRVLSILQIVAGLLMLQYGLAKIFGFPAAPQYAQLATFALAWFAGLIELVCGALVLVGLFTRLAAFILSGEMAFAYFISHAPRGFFPVLNGGSFAILLCFAFLYLAAAGGGPWSVDRFREQARPTRPER